MQLKELKQIPLFQDLTSAEKEWAVDAEPRLLEAGEYLFKEGDVAETFFIVLSGLIRVHRVINGQEVNVSNFPVGSTGGEVPLLTGAPHLAYGRAAQPSEVLELEADIFWQLIGENKTVRERVLQNMSENLRDLLLQSFQREKLVSLGTMSAGLAHELNNPASAAKRAADLLAHTLDEFDQISTSMVQDSMFKQVDPDRYMFQPLADVMNFDLELDALKRGDLEDELGDWMDELGVENPWDSAATLVSVGYTYEILSTFMEQLVPEQVANSLTWITKEVEMRQLSLELIESTSRMSQLVQAMKSYSYMDQAMSKQKTNIHEGLQNTLIILKYKLRKKGIEVVKEFGDDVPEVEAFGGELNQVWTNLLDNSIGAVPEGNGRLTIRTYRDPHDPNMISVEIEDNGSGIPSEVQDRIFDPFFTTKEVGEGTGLGLDIVWRIINNHHQGDLQLAKSEPGQTIFKVCLPIQEK